MIIQLAVFHVLIFGCVFVNSIELKGNSSESLSGNSAGSLGDEGGKIVKCVGRNVGNKGDSVKHVGENVGNIGENSKEKVGEFQLEHSKESPEKHMGEDYSYHLGEKVMKQVMDIADDKERGNTEQINVINDRDKNIIDNVQSSRAYNVSGSFLENRPTNESLTNNSRAYNANETFLQSRPSNKNLTDKLEKNITLDNLDWFFPFMKIFSTNVSKNYSSDDAEVNFMRIGENPSTEKTKNNFSDEIGENFLNLSEKITTMKSKKSVSTTESNPHRNHINFLQLESLYTKNGVNAFFNKTACGRRDEKGLLVGCFTKYCQEHEILTYDVNHTCTEFFNENQHSSYTHSLYFENLDDKNSDYPEHLTVPRGIPCGEAKKYSVKPHNDEDFDFFIYKNGSLKLTEKQNGEHLFLNHKPIYEYCIDNIIENGVKYRMAIVCLKSAKIYAEQNDVTNLGFVSYIESMEPEYYVLNSLLFFINGVIFSIILIVYFLLPQLRTFNGLCVICLSLSSAVASFSHTANSLGGWDEPTCRFIAYTVVFSFLASFFWLNVMCFDIFWVFSGLGQSQMQASKRGVNSKKFIYYSIYSWGWPTAITILIIAMESSLVPRQFFIPKPEFGKTTCFFQSKVAMWVYFYGPVAVILILNLFFFLTTTIKILMISKQTRVLNHDGNKRHDEKEKQRFVLYFKLFLVMGITWLCEVISFHFNEIRELNFLWTITDIGNTLQGIPIFFIFVWKKKTLRLLSERFCPTMNFFEASQASTKTPETSNTTNNNNNPSDKHKITKIVSVEMKCLPPENNRNNIERQDF